MIDWANLSSTKKALLIIGVASLGAVGVILFPDQVEETLESFGS